MNAFELGQVRRVFHVAVSHDARDRYSDVCRRLRNERRLTWFATFSAMTSAGEPLKES